jgi:hypothetical protein
VKKNLRRIGLLACLACLFSIASLAIAVDLSGTEEGHAAFDAFIAAVETGEAYTEPSGTWNAETDGKRVFDILKNQSNDLAETIPWPDDPFAMASGEAENWDNYVNMTGSIPGVEAEQAEDRAAEDAWTHRWNHPHTIMQFHDDMKRDSLLADTEVKNTVGQRS